MYKIALFIFSSIAIGVTLLLVVPDWKESVKEKFAPEATKVLAEIEADVKNDGSIVRVSKVKIGHKIYLKLFEKNGEIWKPIQSILLPDSFDGYATISGDPKNLAVLNLDDDGALEIIAPTFDKDMVAFLNIFKYVKLSNDFRRIQNDSLLNSK